MTREELVQKIVELAKRQVSGETVEEEIAELRPQIREIVGDQPEVCPP